MSNFLKNHSVFFIITASAVFFALPYFEGIHPCDPGDYYKCAFQFLNGELNLKNFYCNRVGTWLPIAIGVKIFGLNGNQLPWITAFEFIALITLLYAALYRYNKEIALISAAIVGFSPVMLLYSGGLWGDIMAALTSNLCIIWIWYFRFHGNHRNPVLSGVLLTLMWFFALITKETAFYYLLPILIVMICDKRNKSFNHFWNAFLITFLVAGGVLLAAYAYKTGNVFYKLRLVEQVPNVHTYLSDSWKVILYRISFLPIEFLTNEFSFFAVFVPGLIFLAGKSKNESESFFKIYFSSLLALWWFGTQSFSGWKPVLLVDRLWLPLMVPMAITAAHVYYSVGRGYAHSFRNFKTQIILCSFFIAVLLMKIFESPNNTFSALSNEFEFIALRTSLLVFLFLAIFYESAVPSVLSLVQRVVEAAKHNYIILFLLVLAFIYNTRRFTREDLQNNNYVSEREMIEAIAKNNEKATILCENCIQNNHGIYYDFNPDVEKRLSFVNWNKTGISEIKDIAKRQPVFMLCSKDRIKWYAGLAPSGFGDYNPLDSVPRFVINPGAEWDLIKESSETILYRYRGHLPETQE